MLSAGTKICCYTIAERIGAGAMGEIYRARDEELGRDVALKFLFRDQTEDSEALERFLREARATSALNHPNIVTVHEIGESDEGRFIAMELVNGRTLRAMSGTRPKLREIVAVGRQIAQALKATHASGIAHRDLKPENLMVRPDGYVKVLDFGLARLTRRLEGLADPKLADMTSPGTVIGTARYMSPEQARGDTITTATDIFSFGLILFEWATGRHPFASDFPMEVIRAIMSDPAPPVSRWRPDLPQEFERLLNRMLAKKPEERPTAPEVESALEALQSTPALAAAQTHAPAPASQPAAEKTAPVSWPTPEDLPSHYGWGRLAAIMAAIALLAGGGFLLFSNRDATSPIDSIAVLPFVHAGEDPNAEMLADGLTESLIDSLAQIRQLRVLARSTVFRFKGREQDPQVIGRDLGVRAVLTGRLVPAGNRVRLSTELVKVTDGSRLWGAEMERAQSELQEMRQEVAREITGKLQISLSGGQRERLARADTRSPEAYRLYLQARALWNRRTPAAVQRAIELLQQAVSKDPEFALAYAALADAYGVTHINDEPNRGYERLAHTAARRALELDPSLGEAHAIIGALHVAAWEFESAEREFQTALELSPNYPSAWQWYGMLLRATGRADKSVEAIERAYARDPLSPVITVHLISTKVFAGDLPPALRLAERLLELEPGFDLAHLSIADVLARMGRIQEALVAVEKGYELSGKSPGFLPPLGYHLALAGRRDEALAIAQKLDAQAARGEDSFANASLVYVGLGDLDAAFARLDRAIERREPGLPILFSQPPVPALAADPRMAELVRKFCARK